MDMKLVLIDIVLGLWKIWMQQKFNQIIFFFLSE
jgi:hypothetical protein